MVEVEGIIKNRVVQPNKGFTNLARKGNVFYTLSQNKIYKGNPRENWTEIADILTLKGSIACIKYNNDSFEMLKYDDSMYDIYLYRINNSDITLLKTIHFAISNRNVSFFIIDNYIYQAFYYDYKDRIYKTNIDTGETTEITSQISGDKHLLCEQERESVIIKIMINNKVYILKMSSPNVDIYTFNGMNIEFLKTIKTENAKCIYTSQIMQVDAKECYTILSGDYSSNYKYQPHYLLDENFNIVDTISTIYVFNKNSYFCIKENEKYTYITREHMYDKNANLVEFPVKAYVGRE